jgi:hypothetical protein
LSFQAEDMFSRSPDEVPLIDKEHKGYKNWLILESQRNEEGRLYVRLQRRMLTLDKLDIPISARNYSVPIIWGAHDTGRPRLHV